MPGVQSLFFDAKKNAYTLLASLSVATVELCACVPTRPNTTIWLLPLIGKA